MHHRPSRNRSRFQRIPALFALLCFAPLLLSGCTGAGRSEDPAEPVATLEIAADPALAALLHPVENTRTHRFAASSAQQIWEGVHVDVVDLANNASITPTAFTAEGATLRIAGPFPGRRIALRLTNSGDLLTRHEDDGKGGVNSARARIRADGGVEPLGPWKTGTKMEAGDDFPLKRSLILLLGEVPPGAAGATLSALPPAGIAELLASHALLSEWDNDLTFASLHARYAPESADHPLRRNATALRAALAAGDLNKSPLTALNAWPEDEAFAHLADSLINRAAEMSKSRYDFTTVQTAIGKRAAATVIERPDPERVALESLPGRTVTIRGTGFGTDKDAATVKIGGIAATVLSAKDDALVVALADPAVVTGTHLVTVKIGTKAEVVSPIALTIE